MHKGLFLDPLSQLCTVRIQAGVLSVGKCCMLLDETSGEFLIVLPCAIQVVLLHSWCIVVAVKLFRLLSQNYC